MKKIKIIPIITLIIGFSLGIYFVGYSSTYSSEEISYDNTKSGAEAENVKEAIDFLYSHGLGLCPEDMTCIESPIVTINVEGPGSVDKESMHVRINGSNKFIVTPNENFTLNSISCDNGYTLSDFKTLSTEAMSPQEITVNNPNIGDGSTCNVKFSTNEISIESLYYLKETNKGDVCNEAKVGCACYYMKNGGSNFTYGDHTGCNFISKICNNTQRGGNINCSSLVYTYGIWNGGYSESDTACSGVITCET